MRNKQKLINLAYESSILYAKDLPGEPFHDDYKKDKDIFRLLVKTDRLIERNFKKHFKEFANLAVSQINWTAYQNKALQASELDDWITVDWNAEQLSIKVLLTKSVVDAIVAGGRLMELDSGADIGWNKNAPTVLDFLEKYGLQKAKRINEVTQDRVKSALKLSLSNGESTEDARLRVFEVIDDRVRSGTIARTESVEAFAAGRRSVALELDFKYKEWHTVIGACPLCEENARDGRIPIDKAFSSGVKDLTAHPNDRCSVRYYREETGD